MPLIYLLPSNISFGSHFQAVNIIIFYAHFVSSNGSAFFAFISFISQICIKTFNHSVFVCLPEKIVVFPVHIIQYLFRSCAQKIRRNIALPLVNNENEQIAIIILVNTFKQRYLAMLVECRRYLLIQLL